MKSQVLLSALAAVVLSVSPVAVAQSASDLLEKGIYTEETVGDLDAAIAIYQRIVDEAKANRPFAAKIEPDPRRPVLIRTIRDIGYRFEMP